MPSSCSAYGCTQRKRSDEITFHRFPQDPVSRKLWISATRRKNFSPSKSAVLCSKHFREVDMDRTSLSVVRVRAGAVPSIFDFPEYLQEKLKNKRKPPSLSTSACASYPLPSVQYYELQPCNMTVISTHSSPLVRLDESHVAEISKVNIRSKSNQNALDSSPDKAELKEELFDAQNQVTTNLRNNRIPSDMRLNRLHDFKL